MKLWIDDTRPAPEGWEHIHSVWEAIRTIILEEEEIEIISLDHDAERGGDYIKLLDWLEETGRNYPIHIHSMNPRWYSQHACDYRTKWLGGS